MHKALTVVALAGAVVRAASAQGTPVATTAKGLRCAHSDAARNTLGRRAFEGGITLTVTRDAGEVELECIATVRDRAGRTIYREAGFGVALDTAGTGKDVNGDGVGDLVLEIDTGGGNHCCWKSVVVSLKPPARKLLEFPWSGVTRFEKDADGRVSLWSWEGGFFGPDRSMAGRIFAQRVYRIAGEQLLEVTPDYCARILADSRFPFERADSMRLRRLAASATVADSLWDIAGEVEGRMLQLVFCRRFDDALAVGNAWWPAADRRRMIPEFGRMVSAAYKEYAAALRDWR